MTGTNGVIGKILFNSLSVDYDIKRLKLSDLFSQYGNIIPIKEKVRERINDFLYPNNYPRIGLIFCHRIRESKLSTEDTVSAEFMILNTVIEECLKIKNTQINIIVIGSITGQLIDVKSSLQYHLQKELQKSFVRYIGVIHPNISANIIEISAFSKYEHGNPSPTYLKTKDKIESYMNHRLMPNYNQLSNLIRFLLLENHGLSSQVIRLDNGYLSFQPH